MQPNLAPTTVIGWNPFALHDLRCEEVSLEFKHAHAILCPGTKYDSEVQDLTIQQQHLRMSGYTLDGSEAPTLTTVQDVV